MKNGGMSGVSPVHEVKFAPLNLKSVDPEGRFSGYASLFHEADLEKDIVAPGAFKKSLRKRGIFGVKMLFQHHPDEVIGVWQDIHEDVKGLYVSGQLLTETSRAREIYQLMRAGALDGLSIGFRTLKSTRDPTTRVRMLTEVDLWEISVVTFPMQPGARIGQVKSSQFEIDETEILKTVIANATFQMRQATSPSNRH